MFRPASPYLWGAASQQRGRAKSSPLAKPHTMQQLRPERGNSKGWRVSQ